MSTGQAKPQFLCPKCGGDKLKVVVQVWADLTQEPDGNLQTDLDENDSHEWHDDSTMICANPACTHSEPSIRFNTRMNSHPFNRRNRSAKK